MMGVRPYSYVPGSSVLFLSCCFQKWLPQIITQWVLMLEHGRQVWGTHKL